MSKLKKLEEAIKLGRASKGGGGGVAGNSPATARHRRGNAGQGVPGRAFPAPHSPCDDASQAPTPDATRLPFQRLPCSPCFCLGAYAWCRKELA